jgi:hypothetical protein
VAERDGGQVVALVIGLVPRSLPIGSDVPELWARLEYEAARARRFGRERGQEVDTILVLSDSAAEAVVALAEESESGAICLAYESGLWAALRRWCDPLWRQVLDEAPLPVILERPGRQVRSDTASLEPLPFRGSATGGQVSQAPREA